MSPALQDVIGLVPAAGVGRRVAPLPCSKEIYPVGVRPGGDGRGARPKVASQYLLENMRRAGVRRAYVVLRKGKWDIPAYWKDGRALEMHLAYLVMRWPYGAPFTLDQAYPFLRGHEVALGFPDILFEPTDAYARMLEKQERTGADVVLGLFPAREPRKVDMVDLDAKGAVRSIVIKPRETDLRYTWIIATWGPAFTEFLHTQVEDLLAGDHSALAQEELYVGDLFRRGMDDGLSIGAVRFPEGTYVDVGTPDALLQTVHAETQPCSSSESLT